MLQIGSDRLSRRDFLKVGSLALGGLTLPQLLSARVDAASQKLPITDKSVVFVFMQGGPSQIETFDPKMTAPAGIRSANGEIATSLPGITFGSAFPQLAARAHQVAIVRSFTTGDANHDIKPIVCRATGGANLGSLYSRVAGTNRPVTGMPTNVAVYPQAVDPSTRPPIQDLRRLRVDRQPGKRFSPFAPSGGGDLKADLRLGLPLSRLDDRRHLLAGLDRIRRSIDSAGLMAGVDSLRQQAFDTVIGGVADAFNLAKESPATVARYDTAPLVRPHHIDPKWHNHLLYEDNAKALGKLMLLGAGSASAAAAL